MLPEVKRYVFEDYESDRILYDNDIEIDLNDFSIKLKGNNLIDIDKLGSMTEAELKKLDSFFREYVYINTSYITRFGLASGDFRIPPKQINTNETNKITDIAKTYLSSFDDNIHINAPVIFNSFTKDNYDKAITLKHIDSDDNYTIMNQKHVASHIIKLCKKHKEETRIVNVLFDIMKLLENKNINVIYDKIVINKNRASLYIDERELPFTITTGMTTGHITKLFTRDFIDMKWTFEKLSKEVAHILPRGLCYESVVNLYNKVKMLD